MRKKKCRDCGKKHLPVKLDTSKRCQDCAVKFMEYCEFLEIEELRTMDEQESMASTSFNAIPYCSHMRDPVDPLDIDDIVAGSIDIIKENWNID